jgi:hypothetical protein
MAATCLDQVVWLVFALEGLVNFATAIIALTAPSSLLSGFGIRVPDSDRVDSFNRALEELARGYGVVLLVISLVVASAILRTRGWAAPEASVTRMKEARTLWTVLLVGDAAQLWVSLHGVTWLPSPDIDLAASAAVILTFVFMWARIWLLAEPYKSA